MPPGPAYNWLCVAHSLYDILGHAAHIRAAQLARAGRAVGAGADQLSRKRKRDEHSPASAPNFSERLEKPVTSTTPDEPRPKPVERPLAVPDAASEAASLNKAQPPLAHAPLSPASSEGQENSYDASNNVKPDVHTPQPAPSPAVLVHVADPVRTTAVHVQVEPTSSSQAASSSTNSEPETQPSSSEVPSVGNVSASTGIPDPGEVCSWL